MKKRLLDLDDGVATFHYFDEATKKTIIQTSQDVEPLLDINQRKLNDSDKSWKGDFHHVASIPVIVWEQWWHELGSNPGLKENRQWLAAKLNSKDWCKLRTKEGRI